MKRKIKFVLSVFLTLVLIFNTVLIANAVEKDNTNYENDFSDNSLIVTIKNTYSLTFKEYTVSDFSEIEAVEVSNILESSYDYENVNMKRYKLKNRYKRFKTTSL